MGIGRAIVQELAREMRHLLPGNSFDDQKCLEPESAAVSQCNARDVRRARALADDDAGSETLLAEFAAFPDGRHDDQVDALSDVAANRELVIRRARLYGERLSRIRQIAPIVPPPPPKSRDQELWDRRRQHRY